MAHTVLLIRPSKDIAAAAMTAVERFQKIAGAEVTIYRQNVNQAADAIESGQVGVVFLPTAMERSEANVFIGSLERSKNPPIVITSADNYEKIEKSLPKEKLCKAKNDFTMEFIFACLRNLLTPRGYRLDSRYFKSILTSVMDVILKNTGLRLIPGQVTAVKAEESSETIAASIAFYGDGIYGSLSILTSNLLTQRLGEKILMMDAEQISGEMSIDLLAEISNQIMGVMRDELREFGWTLQSSMQIVNCGDPFLSRDTGPGTSFKLPFTLDGEKFDILFRYNTYQVSVQEIEISMDNRRGNNFDVRLLNLSTEICQLVFRSFFSVDPRKQAIHAGIFKPHPTQAVYVVHAGGWQGEYTMAIEMDYETAILLAKRVKKTEQDSPDSTESQIRVFSTMIQKIGQEFNKHSRQFGYVFDPICSSAAFSTSPFQHMLRSPGYFIRVPFLIGASRFVFCFGLRSDYAKTLFDAWPLVTTMPEFHKENAAS